MSSPSGGRQVVAAPTSRWRAAPAMLRLTWAADLRRCVLAFSLHSISTLAQTLMAWWLKLALDGLAAHDAYRACRRGDIWR